MWPVRMVAMLEDSVLAYVCFETGPLQCLRDVPQRLIFLNIVITIDIMQIDGHQRTVFEVSTFYKKWTQSLLLFSV